MNLLVISPYVPMPDRGSGELRLFSLLKMLAKSNQVTLYTWSWGQDVSDDEKNRYRENIAAEGIIQESQGLKSLLLRAKFDAVIFEWYYWVDWYLDDVRTWQPQAKVIIDTVDLEFRRLKIQASAAGGFTDAELANRKRQELNTYQKADMLVAVSGEEQRILAAEMPNKPIVSIPNIHVFATMLPALSADQSLIFIGNFRFDPNLDAVKYFGREIWPSIRSRIPSVRFRIVGNALPKDFRLEDMEGVDLIGYVPETAPHLLQSRVSVAPLRFGAGVKGKVGEAVACGVPVVTTSIGAQGMPFIPGREILVGDSPKEFANAVIALLEDIELCENQRRRAWERLKAEFGFDAVSARVDAVLEQIPQLPSNSLTAPRRWARRVRHILDQHVLWRLPSS